MRTNWSRLARVGILALVFSVTAGLALGTVADAKKKKKKKKSTPVTNTVTISKTSPTTLPPGTPAQPAGCTAAGGTPPPPPQCTSAAKASMTTIPLTVSNQGSNTVSPSNLSFSFTITGSPRTGAGTLADTPAAASQVFLKVTAPNGRTIFLPNPGFNDQNATTIGPVTLSSNSPFSVCSTATIGTNGTQTICDPNPAIVGPDDPEQTIGPPTYAGTIGVAPLAVLTGAPANGIWTFKAFNASTSTATTSGTPATLNNISATFSTQGTSTAKKKKKKKKKKK